MPESDLPLLERTTGWTILYRLKITGSLPLEELARRWDRTVPVEFLKRFADRGWA